MLTTAEKARGLADLPPVQSDSLLQLIALCNADSRPEKIDVGVGVWRDDAGNTPILKTIKKAEQRRVAGIVPPHTHADVDLFRPTVGIAQRNELQERIALNGREVGEPSGFLGSGQHGTAISELTRRNPQPPHRQPARTGR